MTSAQTANVSIIIPTYNESQNILNILEQIKTHLTQIPTQTIIVDDNSPDGTGKVVDEYLKNMKKLANNTIDIIHRKTKTGLASAILKGIQHARGETIVVMDSDLSHPPYLIPQMLDSLKKDQFDVVIASRYIKGGNIKGWPIKRKLVSKIATLIAKKGLGIKINDPMSGFFAFKKTILKGISFDALGYKLLLELLVKKRNVKIHEIPYTFEDRKFGYSKLDLKTSIDYLRSIIKLYKFGKIEEKKEPRTSIRFFSKAARFFTVGASGFGINFLVSFLLTNGILDLWYLHANIFGIIISMSSNFFLNKSWTFSDMDFSLNKTLKQYSKFVCLSSVGALIQLGLVFYLVDIHQILYPLALIIAVTSASFGNFIFNKKWTFKEKIWS